MLLRPGEALFSCHLRGGDRAKCETKPLGILLGRLAAEFTAAEKRGFFYVAVYAYVCATMGREVLLRCSFKIERSMDPRVRMKQLLPEAAAEALKDKRVGLRELLAALQKLPEVPELPRAAAVLALEAGPAAADAAPPGARKQPRLWRILPQAPPAPALLNEYSAKIRGILGEAIWEGILALLPGGLPFEAARLGNVRAGCRIGRRAGWGSLWQMENLKRSLRLLKFPHSNDYG